ncbi:hypothetical protein DY000_02053711 [Brassica cretica]|uniref:Uncharacterized protein n=1 Tax=Brassica cretica TaxID=69181 RepID=A0ABQ7AHC2_BRACR|nr:hypothetical protein DY000_02053711 [Brassica cretica]
MELDWEIPNSPVVECPTLHGLSREVGRAHGQALHDDASRGGEVKGFVVLGSQDG